MKEAAAELDGVIAAAQEFQSWFEREVRPKLGDDIGIRVIVERASFNAWLASRGLSLDRAVEAEAEQLVGGLRKLGPEEAPDA